MAHVIVQLSMSLTAKKIQFSLPLGVSRHSNQFTLVI